MLDALSDAIARLVPLLTRLAHQTFPSVIATLIAAGLIAGYNRAFSGHLQQPRMSALHQVSEAAGDGVTEIAPPALSRPAETKSVETKPVALPAAEYFAMRERAAPDRLRDPLEKSAFAESGKDQSARLAATAPLPQPASRAAAAPRPEPRVATVDPAIPVTPSIVTAPAMPAPIARPQMTAPVVAAPVVTREPVVAGPVMREPVVVAPMAREPVVQPVLPEPPPVIVGTPQPVIVQQVPASAQPMVTVPDRPGMRPVEAAAEEPPPGPPRGPIGALVNTLRPSSLFARAREFGERIEAAGNELLPNIRQ